MQGESIIITGVERAKHLAEALVGDLIWFSVEPLTDEQYVFTVRTENLERAIARVRERQTPAELPVHPDEHTHSTHIAEADSDL